MQHSQHCTLDCEGCHQSRHDEDSRSNAYLCRLLSVIVWVLRPFEIIWTY